MFGGVFSESLRRSYAVLVYQTKSVFFLFLAVLSAVAITEKLKPFFFIETLCQRLYEYYWCVRHFLFSTYTLIEQVL